jgi:hypothetical protein
MNEVVKFFLIEGMAGLGFQPVGWIVVEFAALCSDEWHYSYLTSPFF